MSFYGFMLPLIGVMSLWAGVYYWFFYKDQGFCKIILTEKVGDAEIYKGIFVASKKHTMSTEFLVCNRLDHFAIDIPDSKDFFHSDNGKKFIWVCKFGERDYRVKKKFDGTYYKDVTEIVYDEIEDSDTGEVKRVPRLDDNSNPVYEIRQDFYNEPRGVDQKGMDAIRTGLQNERELEKERGDNTFWDKYGQHVLFVGALMIIAMMVMKVSGDNKEIIVSNGESCSLVAGKIDKAASKIDNPSWARGVLDTIASGEYDEKDPPPK